MIPELVVVVGAAAVVAAGAVFGFSKIALSSDSTLSSDLKAGTSL